MKKLLGLFVLIAALFASCGDSKDVLDRLKDLGDPMYIENMKLYNLTADDGSAIEEFLGEISFTFDAENKMTGAVIKYGESEENVDFGQTSASAYVDMLFGELGEENYVERDGMKIIKTQGMLDQFKYDGNGNVSEIKIVDEEDGEVNTTIINIAYETHPLFVVWNLTAVGAMDIMDGIRYFIDDTETEYASVKDLIPTLNPTKLTITTSDGEQGTLDLKYVYSGGKLTRIDVEIVAPEDDGEGDGDIEVNSGKMRIDVICK